MKKKVVDNELHGTAGVRFNPPPKVTSRVVSGTTFSKKANMNVKYTKYNKKGQSDLMEYYG